MAKKFAQRHTAGGLQPFGNKFICSAVVLMRRNLCLLSRLLLSGEELLMMKHSRAYLIMRKQLFRSLSLLPGKFMAPAGCLSDALLATPLGH